jgi:hypothetical protein
MEAERAFNDCAPRSSASGCQTRAAKYKVPNTNCQRARRSRQVAARLLAFVAANFGGLGTAHSSTSRADYAAAR